MSTKARLGAVLALLTLGLSVAIAHAELVQKGSLRLGVKAEFRPRRLPRVGSGPIAVSIASVLSTTDGSVPPSLKKMRIELNRHASLDTAGLPECRIDQIQPASTARALQVCRPALVGRGSFSVDVLLGGQQPYPTGGSLLLFNGQTRCRPPSRRPCQGRPELLGQIYAAHPFANSFVIPFSISRSRHGRYGVALTATLPAAFTRWGHITNLHLRLARRYGYRGTLHSFISAGCPVPDGFSRTPFSLARTNFTYSGGKTLSETLSSECVARG